jgi:hypothetical protein
MAVYKLLQMTWICRYQIPDDQSDVTITYCTENFHCLITRHWVTDVNITWHTETFPNLQRPSEDLINLPDPAHHLQLPTHISYTEWKQLLGDMFYVVILISILHMFVCSAELMTSHNFKRQLTEKELNVVHMLQVQKHRYRERH